MYFEEKLEKMYQKKEKNNKQKLLCENALNAEMFFGLEVDFEVKS